MQAGTMTTAYADSFGSLWAGCKHQQPAYCCLCHRRISRSCQIAVAADWLLDNDYTNDGWELWCACVRCYSDWHKVDSEASCQINDN